MHEEREEEDTSSPPSQVSQGDEEGRKVRPPNRKKHDEEMDRLQSQIRDKEAELERLKASGQLSITNELKNLRAEKSAAVAKRKQIDVDLEKVNREVPEKMRHLSQLESSLYYKNEDKINTAIQRLEWNLQVQTFKLMEEKKIVSEIDSLKRSKKTLAQYQTLKNDINGIRDTQRRMRDERDKYIREFSKLKAEEEKLKRNNSYARSEYARLKHEIDDLYERKRQVVASFKKQKEEFNGVKEKQRKESWKKKEEHRKSFNADKRKQQAEIEAEKLPFEEEINLCNTLMNYLSRMSSLTVQEPSVESLSPASSVDEPELAEEIDDGQYVLLKKSGEFESLEHSGGARRLSRKNRRSRKQTMGKKITLNPKVMEQFTMLGLTAPSSMAEAAEAIECLKAKKAFFEREQQPNEVSSDAGISATESTICEMSRQASKTESCEGGVDTNPGDLVYADLLHGCQDGSGDHLQSSEVEGAVGGCDVSLDIASPSSDSTVDGDTGSGESQSSVCESGAASRSPKEAKNKPAVSPSLSRKEVAKEGVEKSNLSPTHRKLQAIHSAPPEYQRHLSPRQGERGGGVPRDSMKSPKSGAPRPQDCRPKSKNDSQMPRANQWRSSEKPSSLLLQQSSPTSSMPQSISLLSPLDFPTLTPSSATSPLEGKSICGSPADPLRSAKSPSPVRSPTRPQQAHRTLAARMSYPSATTGTAGQQQHTLAVPLQQSPSQPRLILDNDDFPPLSQTTAPSRRGSNLSTRSSTSSSANQDNQSQPSPASCDQQHTVQITNQISDLSSPSHPSTGSHGPIHSSTGGPTQPSHPPHMPPTKPVPGLSLTEPLAVSQIMSVDKLSTERWVESSVAFAKVQCDENTTAGLSETTWL